MSNDNRQWYAVRVSYGRELILKRIFDKKRIRSYVPMHYVQTEISGRRKRVRQPMIHNLIFVRITPSWLLKIREQAPVPFGYISDHLTRQPLVIPDKEMDDFIAVTACSDEEVMIIDPQCDELVSGDKVRIVSGRLCGVEGEYVRYKSKNRVIVKIRNFIFAATAEIPLSQIEKIE